MIDHRGDCNAQPCTCGAKAAAWVERALKNRRQPIACYCGGKNGCTEACTDE